MVNAGIRTYYAASAIRVILGLVLSSLGDLFGPGIGKLLSQIGDDDGDRHQNGDAERPQCVGKKLRAEGDIDPEAGNAREREEVKVEGGTEPEHAPEYGGRPLDLEVDEG
jgi:hypothetical protein